MDEVASWLRKDFHLGENAPGGMCRYREAVAASFFLKFYIDVKNQLYERGVVKVGESGSRLRQWSSIR